MTTVLRKLARVLVPGAVALLAGFQAQANTLNQNVSGTIDRAGTSAKYRVVAYGDSIYAGYNGSTVSAAKYAAPTSVRPCGRLITRRSGTPLVAFNPAGVARMKGPASAGLFLGRWPSSAVPAKWSLGPIKPDCP